MEVLSGLSLITLLLQAYNIFIPLLDYRSVHVTPDSKVYGANMGPAWADRTQIGPMMAPWTLLSGTCSTYGRIGYRNIPSLDNGLVPMVTNYDQQ